MVRGHAWVSRVVGNTVRVKVDVKSYSRAKSRPMSLGSRILIRQRLRQRQGKAYDKARASFSGVKTQGKP